LSDEGVRRKGEVEGVWQRSWKCQLVYHTMQYHTITSKPDTRRYRYWYWYRYIYAYVSFLVSFDRQQTWNGITILFSLLFLSQLSTLPDENPANKNSSHPQISFCHSFQSNYCHPSCSFPLGI